MLVHATSRQVHVSEVLLRALNTTALLRTHPFPLCSSCDLLATIFILSAWRTDAEPLAAEAVSERVDATLMASAEATVATAGTRLLVRVALPHRRLRDRNLDIALVVNAFPTPGSAA
jgi:hypothetical protein